MHKPAAWRFILNILNIHVVLLKILYPQIIADYRRKSAWIHVNLRIQKKIILSENVTNAETKGRGENRRILLERDRIKLQYVWIQILLIRVILSIPLPENILRISPYMYFSAISAPLRENRFTSPANRNNPYLTGMNGIKKMIREMFYIPFIPFIPVVYEKVEISDSITRINRIDLFGKKRRMSISRGKNR